VQLYQTAPAVDVSVSSSEVGFLATVMGIAALLILLMVALMRRRRSSKYRSHQVQQKYHCESYTVPKSPLLFLNLLAKADTTELIQTTF
jgi:MYXO-CTERM domain-containing protein